MTQKNWTIHGSHINNYIFYQLFGFQESSEVLKVMNSIANFLHSAFNRSASKTVIKGDLARMVVALTIIRLMPLYGGALIQAYHL